MKPRTLCASHPVAFIISARVAPLGCRRRARISAFLLPSRAVTAFFWLLGGFLVGLAFLAALALEGATWAARALVRAFFARLGVWIVSAAGVLPFSSAIEVVISVLLARAC